MSKPISGSHIVTLITETTDKQSHIFKKSFRLKSAFETEYGDPVPDIYSNCGEDILGGYGKIPPWSLISREYVGLPAHNVFYFRFTLYAIDNWTDDDGINLILNGYTIIIYEFDTSTFPSNLCGGPANDNIYIISGYVKHTASTLNFIIEAAMLSNPTTASFGIRDLQLKFVTESVGSVVNFCIDIPDHSSIDPCCPEAEYLDGFDCSPCAPGCSRCKGPNPTDCKRCLSGYFLYWNSTWKPHVLHL